ncbi:heterokaryon incompatibility protein-domain-containing protein [Xylaria cubensis]|nr:heterokaryon incompatibility protein-domain-containing protein [Xylaria cubensis]
MRCATCTALRSDDIIGGTVQIHDNVQALKASAAAGCDLCTLCWTRIVQQWGKQNLEYLLQGLDTSGERVDDEKVYLQGQIYPSRPPRNIDYGDHAQSHPGNQVLVILGLIDSSILAYLKVFADPGTPAAQVYTESWTTVDRNPKFHISFIQYLMSLCRTQHKLCTSSFFHNMTKLEMPTRLIDIGDPSQDKKKPIIRLVTTRTLGIQAQPYIALSYCWGKSMQYFTCLRTNNLEALHSCIEEKKLPKSHRDTLQLARDLGFRYVWIDALCIIQGDGEDWASESRRMAQVYGNATLTIIAGRAANCAEGFLENRFRPAVEPCAIPFIRGGARQGLTGDGEMAGHIWIALPRSPLDGPTAQRGWCFQESILSSRALVFGKEQLYFECQMLQVHEDGRSRRAMPFQIQNGVGQFSPSMIIYNSITTTSPPRGELSNGLGQDEEREITRRWLFFWYDTVLYKYTSRDLTEASDVFTALSGLAQIVKVKVRSRYLGGLWESDIVRGLLWEVRSVRYRLPVHELVLSERRVVMVTITDANGVKTQEAAPIQVPSWSWASVKGQVSSLRTRFMDYPVPNRLVHPKYPGERWTRDPVSCHAAEAHIRSCELEFFGRLRRVRCKPNHFLDNNENLREKLRSANVNLIPTQDETDHVSAVAASDDSEHIVAEAWFDVPDERVSSCWCVPLIKKAGLMLLREETGKFRRLGIMKVLDLGWMMAVEEEEICLV